MPIGVVCGPYLDFMSKPHLATRLGYILAAISVGQQLHREDAAAIQSARTDLEKQLDALKEDMAEGDAPSDAVFNKLVNKARETFVYAVASKVPSPENLAVVEKILCSEEQTEEVEDDKPTE